MITINDSDSRDVERSMVTLNIIGKNMNSVSWEFLSFKFFSATFFFFSFQVFFGCQFLVRVTLSDCDKVCQSKKI